MEKKSPHHQGNFLRDGKLIRPSQCECCGSECKPQAHHCDYSKPTDVMWLCKSCHVEWHKHNKPIYPDEEPVTLPSLVTLFTQFKDLHESLNGLDLETMGNGPYAPVISIGAVFFDPNTGETGEEFSVNISLESSMRYRARPDASTILWWMEQSEEARKSLTSNTQELSTALSWLSEFIIKNANHKLVQVWGMEHHLTSLFSATVIR